MGEMPIAVRVKFDPPIEPRHLEPISPRTARSVVEDPPLDVDELPGLLSGWQRREDGWWGMVTHGYPHHGYGTALQIIEWYPAERLLPGRCANASRLGR